VPAPPEMVMIMDEIPSRLHDPTKLERSTPKLRQVLAAWPNFSASLAP
jgi:hypothetical protein